MTAPIANKVEKSGIFTLDLAEWFPTEPVVGLDIKPWLVQEIMLQERPFREHVAQHDWEQYAHKRVAVYCSADAIIPFWAYMLIASRLQPEATEVYQGTPEALLTHYYRDQIQGLDPETYRDKRLVIKGCGDLPVPPGAYMEIVMRLQPFVKTIMYGEPCSTVPVYKKPRPKAAHS